MSCHFAGLYGILYFLDMVRYCTGKSCVTYTVVRLLKK